MSDYKNSLQAGLAAAKEAAKNKSEIKEVIRIVSDEVREVSEDKASFGVTIFFEEQPDTSPLAYWANTAQAMLNIKKKSHKGLGIFNSEGKAGIEIATWYESENGYPCKITFSGQDFYCSNRSELESAFSELLKEIKTGEAIIEKIKDHDRK